MLTLCATSTLAPRAGLAPHPPARRVPAPRPRLTSPRALPGVAGNVSLPVDAADLPGYLALALAGASQANARVAAALTPELLFTSLAVYQLLYTGLGAVQGDAPADTVGQFVGPAFLAAAALSFFGRATPFEGAAAAFGVALARRLPGPLVLWVASLAGAVYAGYAAEWAVGAFGLAAALRVAEAVRAKEVPAPAPALFLAFAAYSLYAGMAAQAALLIFGGHVIASSVV